MTRVKTHSKAVAILFVMLMIFGVLFTSMSTVSAADEGILNIHKLSKEGVADANRDSSKFYYLNPTDNLYYEYLAGAKYTVYKIGTFNETNVNGTLSTVFTADQNARNSSDSVITLSSTTVPTDIDLAMSTAAGLTGTETNATTAAGPLSITSGLDTNGVYLIVESTLPSGVSAGADFIITVPMYNVSMNDWKYTVDAYPKNIASSGEITKTISKINGTTVTSTDGTFYGNLDDTFTYVVGITVPDDYTTTNVAPAGNYTKFDIIDESSPHLSVQYSDKPENGITVIGSVSDTFAATTDYTATYNSSGTNKVLTVQFTTAGLAKIVAGETLTVSYDAKLEVGGVSSTMALANKAWINFTKGTGSGTIFPAPTNFLTTIKVYSYGVKKIDDATEPAALAGASFVLATKDNNDDYQYLEYSETATWNTVDEASAQIFTTSTSGSNIDSEAIIQFKNLAPDETYYLFETAAPTGYIKLLNPIEIVATADTTDAVYNAYGTGGTYVAETGYTVEITNVLGINSGVIGGGGLPTTGGSGIYLFLIIGAVLMVSAVVFYIKYRKKNKGTQ